MSNIRNLPLILNETPIRKLQYQQRLANIEFKFELPDDVIEIIKIEFRSFGKREQIINYWTERFKDRFDIDKEQLIDYLDKMIELS